jgi:hypothetical protein
MGLNIVLNLVTIKHCCIAATWTTGFSAKWRHDVVYFDHPIRRTILTTGICEGQCWCGFANDLLRSEFDPRQRTKSRTYVRTNRQLLRHNSNVNGDQATGPSPEMQKLRTLHKRHDLPKLALYLQSPEQPMLQYTAPELISRKDSEHREPQQGVVRAGLMRSILHSFHRLFKKG